MSTEPQTTPPADSTEPVGAPDDLAAAQTRIAALEADLATASERADRYHSNWQRSAADFQNWKRRTDQEKADAGRNAEGALTLELLRVLDDFERAFMALPPDLRSLTWIEGVYMIGQKLFALLQARGLAPIDALNQDFDPFLHEAVLREEGAEGSDALVVVQELQRGYRFHDRVIRPTMVKVGLPSTSDAATDAPASVDADTSPESAGPADEPVAS